MVLSDEVSKRSRFRLRGDDDKKGERIYVMKIDGGCHCGYITYEAEADPEKTAICHCTDCQTLSGSAFRTFVLVAGKTFRILSGEPTIYVKTAESGTKRALGFCSQCGTQIYATSIGDNPEFYNVRVGTTRQRDMLVPKLQFWSRSQLHWLSDLVSIRRLEKQ
jgi:hypothetical protein